MIELTCIMLYVAVQSYWPDRIQEPQRDGFGGGAQADICLSPILHCTKTKLLSACITYITQIDAEYPSTVAANDRLNEFTSINIAFQ